MKEELPSKLGPLVADIRFFPRREGLLAGANFDGRKAYSLSVSCRLGGRERLMDKWIEAAARCFCPWRLRDPGLRLVGAVRCRFISGEEECRHRHSKRQRRKEAGQDRSEEWLGQDFNSPHAQREACAAYVASQTSEEWSFLAEKYHDGGLSGGNVDRPAFKRLLNDIAAGLIDNVVVYKVDRLTRSLLDFAILVEAFDGAGVGFVSLTQSFNATSSMGRLTPQHAAVVRAVRARGDRRSIAAPQSAMRCGLPLNTLFQAELAAVCCYRVPAVTIVPKLSGATRTSYRHMGVARDLLHIRPRKRRGKKAKRHKQYKFRDHDWRGEGWEKWLPEPTDDGPAQYAALPPASDLPIISLADSTIMFGWLHHDTPGIMEGRPPNELAAVSFGLQMVVNIAHGYAVHWLGQGNFAPFLLGIILGQEIGATVPWLIGDYESPRDDSLLYSMKLYSALVSVWNGLSMSISAIALVEVRLFANFGAPVDKVAAGRLLPR